MIKSVIFLEIGCIKITNKIACFNVEDTIIKTQSGKKIPKNLDDIILWDKSVKSYLENLILEKYLLVFFTNQKNKSLNHNIERADKIFQLLNLPFLYLSAQKDDKYKKPNIGLWKILKKYIKLKININESFYAGNLAGRLRGWEKYKKKDSTDTDRKFAYNLNLDFFTPEELFKDECPTRKWKWIGWNPTSKLSKPDLPDLTHNIEMIMVMGSPVSGKTEFIKKYYKAYDYYLDNKELLVQIKNSMIKEKSIIIEGLFPTLKSRIEYLNLAKLNGYKSRLFIMEINNDLSNHLNLLRQSKGEKKVAQTVFNKWKKQYEKPLENWNEIKTVIPKWKKLDTIFF